MLGFTGVAEKINMWSIAYIKRRLVPLLLSFLMLFGAISPTVSAIAMGTSQHTPDTVRNSHTAPAVDTGKKMSNHYPGALAAGSSSTKLAANTNKSIFSSSQDTPISSKGPGDAETNKPSKPVEITSKRTANTKTFDLGNGKMEVRKYMGPVHYKENGTWNQIDTRLVEDTNAAESSNPLGKAIAWAKSETQTLHTYKVKANDWQAKFAASDDPVGMVRIEAGTEKISFSPRNAKAGVVPEVRTDGQGL